MALVALDCRSLFCLHSTFLEIMNLANMYITYNQVIMWSALWGGYWVLSKLCLLTTMFHWYQHFVSAQLDGFWPNFVYALILTTSRLRLINIFYTQYLDKYKIGILLSAYFGYMLYALCFTFHFFIKGEPKVRNPTRGKSRTEHTAVRDVYFSDCCLKRCLNTFTMEAIQDRRNHYWEMGTKQQRNFIYQEIKRSLVDGILDFVVEGTRVCEQAWLKLYGIADRR